MKENTSEVYTKDVLVAHDKQILADIAQAVENGRINADAQDYLNTLYSNSEDHFRDVFNVLGKCFGAPKAAVMPYDYAAGTPIDKPMNISDINPLSAYMVYHRLDADPMRNQFFHAGKGHQIDLVVSSIVSVIVANQKFLERALGKVTGVYYREFVDEVVAAVKQVVLIRNEDFSTDALEEKIRNKFSNKYITNAAEVILEIIGAGHEKLSVDLVRALDKIVKPHLRLRDVWRVKCLFDLVPQARTFIERIRDIAPNSIMMINDRFNNMYHPRNYRDAKIILNIGQNGQVIPLEIICQVRTLFEFERINHDEYEIVRKKIDDPKRLEIEQAMAEFMANGIKEYNIMICDCTNELFERVGWNILYGKTRGDALFDGFPKISKLYYPEKIVDAIMDKLDNAVENEIFHVTTAPAKLTQAQESDIFRWMARFILVSSMPYKDTGWKVTGEDTAQKLFNFVMKELQRHYRSPSDIY